MVNATPVDPIQFVGQVEVTLHSLHPESDRLSHHCHAIALQRAAPERTPPTILQGGLHAEHPLADPRVLRSG